MLTIVDSHHKVLTAWAQYRNTLTHAPRLITLDHHTDTSPPFSDYINRTNSDAELNVTETDFLKKQERLIQSIDFKNEDSINHAIDKLSNDEHIVAAIKSDIISSAFVLAHNAANTDINIYKDHKIMCRTVNEKLNSNNKIMSDHDTVLESKLIDHTISEFNKLLTLSNEASLLKENYILDIDLDYFNTFQSITPKDSKTFETLAKNAGIITIATEPEYVKNCAIDKNLTSSYLLEKLNFYLPKYS